MEQTAKTHTNEKNTALFICMTALATALVCVATMVVQIPIPLGYAHLGDSCILLAAYLFGWKTGLFAGGVGSALADLLIGFPQWAVATLIIKSIQGFLIAKLCRRSDGEVKVLSGRTAIAAVVGIAEMVVGYVIGGAILAGSFAAGLASAPGLILKGILNIVVFYVAALALEKSGATKKIGA